MSTIDTVGVDPEAEIVNLTPSTVHPESLGGRDSISFQSTHAVISIVAGLAACVLVIACVVYYKRKTSMPVASSKDYRGYYPSPFDPTRRAPLVSSFAQSPRDEGLSMESGGEVTPITTLSRDEELSSSYRTCSRIYSERISSEISWAMASSRSIQSNDAENKIAGIVQSPDNQVTHQQQVSALVQQRRNRLSMAFEDSFLDEGINEAHARARENSDTSSELFSTLMESERSSAVSWPLSSSWSGSEVSSLESTRATDVSLSEYSNSSSSRSFRISDVEEQGAEDDEAKGNETRLPEAAAISATVATSADAQITSSERQSTCDSILLFKPIKSRLLRSKPKKPTTVKEEDAEAKDDKAQVWYC